MMKPPGPDRYVNFRWAQNRPFAIAVLKGADDAEAVSARIWLLRWVDRRPVRITGRSAFVAAPSHIGTGVRENHRVRLQPPDVPPEEWPVVDLLLSIRPFTVGAVEPDLRDRAV